MPVSLTEIRQLIRNLSGNKDARREGVKALRNFAVNTANKERIAEAGGIAPLVGLLDDGNTTVRAKAAAALWSLAVNTANKERIAEAGGIAPLLHLLFDANTTVREKAAGALWNLAANTANQERIAEAGGIAPLVGLLADGNVEVRRYAAGALWNLAVNTANKEAIAQAGGIAPLVGLLSDGNEAVRKNAAGALRNLSGNTANKERIAEAGGIVPLVGLLADGSAAVRNEAASVLLVLALQHAANQERITEVGAIAPLVGLLIDTSADVRESAVLALANLAHNHDANRDAIRVSDAIPRVITLLTDANTRVRKFAVLSLAILVAGHATNALAVVDSGGIVVLIKLRIDEDAMVRRYAELSLAVLVGDNPIHDEAIGEPIHLVSLLELLKASEEDDIRQYAVYALDKLAHIGSYRHKMLIEGAVVRLRPLLEDSLPEVKRLARQAITYLSCNRHQEMALQTADVDAGGGGAKAKADRPMPNQLPPVKCYDEAIFRDTGRHRLGGSSFCSGVFEKKSDASFWVGKCNVLSSEQAAKADGCREKIASDIYDYYGASVPKTVLARLPILLPEWAKDVTDLHLSADRTHTVYLLSEIIAGFSTFPGIPALAQGERFCLPVPDQGELEVVGLGRILAVASFIHDVDVIGGSGGNIGYQVVSGQVQCLKIDPGEAFNVNPALAVGAREIRVATQAANGILSFDQFPASVKQEFLETLTLIAETSDEAIAGFFMRPGAESLLFHKDAEMLREMPRIMVARRAELKRDYAADLVGIQGRRPVNLLVTRAVEDQDILATLATIGHRRALPIPQVGGGAGKVDLPEEPGIAFAELQYNPATDLLGSGGYADVYRGTWQGAPVAIKLLKAQGIPAQAVQELRHEGNIMMQLRHPNIMVVYGVCSEPGHYSLIMKYMPRGSLYQVYRITRYRFPPS